ncbi:MAG: Dps family protein [Rickettsiaceae bacterium]
MFNKSMIEALKALLIDQYALYFKTQNYHWNVQGPEFSSLHLLFEEQYQDLAISIDTIAELIRGLGQKVPGLFALNSPYPKTSIKPPNEMASASQMIEELVSDYLAVEKVLKVGLIEAEKIDDQVIADFIIERLTVCRKSLWKLRSSL